MEEQLVRKRGNIIGNIVLVIAIAVFIFSGYKLYMIFSEYHEGEKEYESILDEVIIVSTDDKDQTENQETEEKTVFKVDFEKLKSMNK